MRVGGAQNPLNGSDYGRVIRIVSRFAGGRFSVVVFDRFNIKHVFLARFSDNMQLNLLAEMKCL